MKKKNFNGKLNLSKKTISNFQSTEVKGGTGTFVDCGPLDTRVSICAIGAEPGDCITLVIGGAPCRG
ncbi:hypothetical protein GTQ40_08870 [Flavobacteriaceae bacterium R38]|nr:hypothetical protein [Flavobacteriaceae bacterium R38]